MVFSEKINKADLLTIVSSAKIRSVALFFVYKVFSGTLKDVFNFKLALLNSKTFIALLKVVGNNLSTNWAGKVKAEKFLMSTSTWKLLLSSPSVTLHAINQLTSPKC